MAGECNKKPSGSVDGEKDSGFVMCGCTDIFKEKILQKICFPGWS